jgi:hypothetical protein
VSRSGFFRTALLSSLSHCAPRFTIFSWGVHAVIPKAIFSGFDEGDVTSPSNRRLQGEVDLALRPKNVHWGYFSKDLAPVLTVDSGAEITVEMATHHACDDWDKMIKGDTGMESIFTWSKDSKGEGFRGATGKGDGVHILTGPIYVTGAEPGDILKVEILDLVPRVNPSGKTFGSNAAAWWGFQSRVKKADGTAFTAGTFTKTPNSNDEIVTIVSRARGLSNIFCDVMWFYRSPQSTHPVISLAFSTLLV